MNNTDKRLRVGAVVTTHGLRGELKVYPTTDNPDRFLDLEECMIETKDGLQILHPERVKFFKQFVIIKFKEFDNINDVMGFVKKDILINRDQAVDLEPGEYFICDLVGNKVFTDKDEYLGILKDVITTAANNVYLVEMESGKELLIPVIPDSNIVHDIENKTTKLHLLDGLLDL